MANLTKLNKSQLAEAVDCLHFTEICNDVASTHRGMQWCVQTHRGMNAMVCPNAQGYAMVSPNAQGYAKVCI